MIPADILALYDRQLRRDRAGTATQTIERTPHVTRVVGHVPGAEFGAILHSALTEETADGIIEGEIAYFSSKGLAFEWKAFGHDRPRDLGDRLARLGLKPSDKETLLCRELAEPVSVAAPSGIRIRRIDTVDGIASLAAFDLENEGAENEPLLAELRAELHGAPDSLGIYAAWDGGKPVSRAWIRFHPDRDFADLWGGATLGAYRGRGIYKALVMARAEEARRRGVRFLTTDALPTSQPILERLGFFPLTSTTPFLYVPL